MPVKSRSHKRCPAAGKAEFWTAHVKATGDLLDVGEEGILIRSEVELNRRRRVTVSFKVLGYPQVFETEGRLERVRLSTLAIMFLDKPAGLDELLRWLESGKVECFKPLAGEKPTQ